MVTILKAVGQAIGIDGDDLRVLATLAVVVLAVGVALILLAGLAGVAVACFEAMRGL